MNSLLTALTILVLASVARDHVRHAMTGWDPFAVVEEPAAE
jgi:hypothetical protein